MSFTGFDSEDLKRILSHISEFAETEYGKEFIKHIHILSSLSHIKLEQKRVLALKDFVRKTGFSIPSVDDIRIHLQRATKVDFLTEDETGFIYINIKDILSFINKYYALGLNQLLENGFERILELNELVKELSIYLTESGKINPECSPELKKITKERDYIKETIHQRLDKLLDLTPHIFQDRYYTVREGRYVLPVKTNFKKDIKGTIRDTSQSGDTIFVEPESITSFNDRYILIIKKEEQEKRNILAKITARISENTALIKESLNFFGYIDSLMARVRYLLRYDLNFPDIREGKSFSLYNAYHPLFLEKQDVVKNDFLMPEDKNIFLITGPNGGGKTVSIKTISIIILLSHMAIPVPLSDRSYLSLIQNFCFDMGDHQNIDEGVSSFTSKMLLWKQIMENIDRDTIVFVDELGNFTNPQEGSAISIAFLEEIVKKGGRIIAGTHLDEIKEFVSVRTDGMVSAMLWDEKLKKPAFKISYGSYTGSFAIEVLRELGFQESFIKNCEKNLSSDYIYIEELKRKKQAEYFTCLMEREELEKEKKRLDEIIKEKELLLLRYKEEKNKLILDAKNEINGLLERMDRDIKSLPKDKRLAREFYKTWENESKELLKNLSRMGEEVDEEVIIGDEVHLINLNKDGKVIAMDGEKYNVLTGTLKIWVDKEEIRKTARNVMDKKEIRSSETGHYYGESCPEIDVRGKKVDESIALIDKFIDRAYLSGARKVKIIHGAGTGKLRENIHSYLKTSPVVTGFSLGDLKERGGSYYTLVELK